MHEFDSLTEGVVTQPTEQADDNRKDDQEGVFTEMQRAR